MEPTYHLEGIIKSKEEMEDFEGPLNLILMLLSKNKIEIRDIQISQILEQYLDYIAKMQEMDLEVASEFVQMASHLLYIKTKTLLTGDEEPSELEMLISSLEQLKCRDAYAGIRAVVPELQKASERGILLFSTPGEPQPKYGAYDYRHEKVELLRALASVFSRGRRVPEEAPNVSRIVPRRIPYGVRDKSRELIELLRSRGSTGLKGLYAHCHSRSEIVATFISVLELCSMGSLSLSAADGDCVISLSSTAVDTDAILEGISE